MNSYRIRFEPLGIEKTFSQKLSILDAVQQAGLVIPSFCGGRGTCGKCSVIVTDGTEPLSLSDKPHFASENRARSMRLACQVVVDRDLIVELVTFEVAEKVAILTEGQNKRSNLNPIVRKQFLQIQQPRLESNSSDHDDLLHACGLDLEKIDFPLSLLQELPTRLRQNQYTGTIVYDSSRIIDFEPGDTRTAFYGIAIDLGTTTVVTKLLDLNTGTILATQSDLNPQRSFGADVISRITFATENDVAQLQQSVTALFNHMIQECARQAQVAVDNIYQIVTAGNTAMLHFLLGVNPKWLAEMPFQPTFKSMQRVLARDIGVRAHPHATLVTLPIIGGFVGGDTSAVLITLSHQLDRIVLAIDIGTNGEILLLHRGRILACSTAAGPAFEGSHISCGMRATRGAIDHLAEEQGVLSSHVIGGGDPQGICGSGLIDLVAILLQRGVIHSNGSFVAHEDLPPHLATDFKSRMDYSAVMPRFALDLEHGLFLTQQDLRQVQLAKAAIASGIEILLQKEGLALPDLDGIYIAGAFGQFLNLQNAQIIGLLPSVPVEKVHFIGNAAYDGAERVLLSQDDYFRVIELANYAEHIELANHENFQDIYSDNLFF